MSMSACGAASAGGDAERDLDMAVKTQSQDSTKNHQDRRFGNNKHSSPTNLSSRAAWWVLSPQTYRE